MIIYLLVFIYLFIFLFIYLFTFIPIPYNMHAVLIIIFFFFFLSSLFFLPFYMFVLVSTLYPHMYLFLCPLDWEKMQVEWMGVLSCIVCLVLYCPDFDVESGFLTWITSLSISFLCFSPPLAPSTCSPSRRTWAKGEESLGFALVDGLCPLPWSF